ncbi:hypothetical protein BJX64DRAFT_283260 [Aspergillus heterothallicus]
MGKITFYCNICAGPLSHWELRKRSMLQSGDVEHATFDDECDCDYVGEEVDQVNGEEKAAAVDGEGSGKDLGGDDEVPEPNSEADLARHDSYCNYRRGYWGDILLEKDVEWLSEACMLRVRGSEDDDESEDAQQPSDIAPGECYLTPLGSYDPYDGFTVSNTGENYYPNQGGFMLHAKCWDMLHKVFAATRPYYGRLDPRRLYLIMLSKLGHENDPFVDWGDNRLYGGTEEFAEQEWIPVPGYEWLVADPTKNDDYSGLVREATNPNPGYLRLDGYSPSVVSNDPFARLPVEVQHMILGLLPAQSILNLFVSSRIIHAASASLSQAFWKSRIYKDAQWATSLSLASSLEAEKGKVDYRALLLLLKEASATPLNGSNARDETFLSLKNRRRIWACCEGILDVMETRRKESGSVSRELEAITSSRVARIRQPGLRDMGKLVDSETYFRPRTLDQPSIRGLTVHFSEQSSIVGIEWQLENESTGRLFGTRGAGMQSVALPLGLIISGIVISLGPAAISSEKDRAVRGFGILPKSEDERPCIKLGSWTNDDIVHVFRTANTQPYATIVGIAGQYSETFIIKFGILTTDLANKTVAAAGPIASNLDIYTRWHIGYTPPASKDLQVHTRLGIKSFPLPDISPFDPPILENPAQYIDLRDRQIATIQTFYPLGKKKEFGGFRIDFSDGSYEIVYKEHDGNSADCPKEAVAFDVDAKEAITKLICYFDSNPSRTTPTVLHGIEFITSKNRKLSLGWLDAYSEDYRRDSYIRRGERVVGLHFGIKVPVIESIGLGVSSSSKV